MHARCVDWGGYMYTEQQEQHVVWGRTAGCGRPGSESKRVKALECGGAAVCMCVCVCVWVVVSDGA